jgi:1-acyl-sn-glycerol-3-phosphate acyltransferase
MKLLPARLLPGLLTARMDWELRFGFADILVSGSLREPDPEASTLVMANHACGWDLQVARWLTRYSGLAFNCFTNPSDLQRSPRLAHLGLRAIPRDDPIAAAQVLRREGKRLASTSGQALWIYPQGGFFRVRERPVVETGILGVRASARSVNFASVALHYEMYGPRRAWVWLKIVPVPVPGPRDAAQLGEVIRATHAALMADLRDGTGEYRPILREKSPVVVLDGVPVNVDTVNEFLGLSPGTRGATVVSDPVTRQLVLTGRPVGASAVLSCLRQNLGKEMADLVFSHLKGSADADEPS